MFKNWLITIKILGKNVAFNYNYVNTGANLQ